MSSSYELSFRLRNGESLTVIPGIYSTYPHPQPAYDQPSQAQTVDRPKPVEPIAAQEAKRSPSPFIKREPLDQNKYSSFKIKDNDDTSDPDKLVIRIGDDEVAYDPTQPVSVSIPRSNDKTAYDPAHMNGPALPSLNRMLSFVDGKMVEPPTVCFTQRYRHQQLVHVLTCHGEMSTMKPVSCGSNCKMANEEAKRPSAWPIPCSHPVCKEKKEQNLKKARKTIFVPKKRASTVDRTTPYPEQGPAKRAMRSARLARDQETAARDRDTAGLNKLVETDAGYKILAERATGPGVRRKSKRHQGYASEQEIREEWEAEQMLKTANSLKLGRNNPALKREIEKLQVEGTEKLGGINSTLRTPKTTYSNATSNPMLKRELKNLHVDGTQKLSGLAGMFGPYEKAQQEAAFNRPDKEIGADTQNDRPWSYSNSLNAKPGRRAIRSEEAFNWSIPQTRYDAMVEEENGVVIEREDTRTGRLPRNLIDAGDQSDDEDMAPVHQSIEACGACEIVGDGHLEECTVCHSHFQPACVNKEVSPGPMPEANGEIPTFWICDGVDGEPCDREMTGVRYMCTSTACRDHDWCVDCVKKLADRHALEMAARGDDPEEHKIVAVRGDRIEFFRNLYQAKNNKFLCKTCEEGKQAMEDLAKEKAGNAKIPLTIGEIRKRNAANKKAKENAMKEEGTYAAVQERIHQSKISGVRKTGKPNGSALSKTSSTKSQALLEAASESSSLTGSTRITRSRKITAPIAGSSLAPINEGREDIAMDEADTGNYDPTLFGEM